MAKKESKTKVENVENVDNIEDVVVESGDNQVDFSKISYAETPEDKREEFFDSMKKANVVLMSMLTNMEKKCREMEAKAQGKVSDDTYMRLIADHENFKRRSSTSRSEGYNDGQVEVLTSIVEIVDNLDRAISMIADENVASGVKMIQKQLMEKLAHFGVTEIDCLGKPFDPEFHNAVMQGEAETPEQADTVIEVFQKGYYKGTKVLRHSFVKVAV